MSAYQRRKGHVFERFVAREHSDVTGHPHKRVLNETRDGNSGDVTGKLSGPVSLTAQCKVGARPNVREAVEQAVAGKQHAADVAVACVKWDGGFTIAAVEWEDWRAILDCLARAEKAGLFL